LRKYAKSHWIPTEVCLPDSERLVQIQLREFPDPTIGYFCAEKGRWIIEESCFSENDNYNPIAWREMADPYIPPDEDTIIFRCADEARILSFNALNRIKQGNPNKEFYDVRLKALAATEQGKFNMFLENPSDDILRALIDRGYEITKKETGYLISWE
jgi:hypothetical protein